MGHIFLSYAREDRDFAECLARVLEGAGHSVWWDRHIDSGEEFAAEIEARLEVAQAVVVAWSKHSVKSRWVRDEAAVGGDTGRLIPVRIDESRPPMGFRQFHTMDLSGWKGDRNDERTSELLRSVDRRLKAEDKAAPAAPTVAPRRRFTGRRRLPKWLPAAAAVLVIAAASAMYFLNSRETMRGPLPKPTIALLPFTSAAPDSELRDLAAQSRDSIAHTLSQTGMPVRLVSTVPQDRRSAGDFTLSGELSRTADKVVATVRLDEAAHGVTILTKRIDADREEIQNLPERVGAQVAATFDGATLLVLDRRHPLDPALMAELLADSNDLLQNYQTAKRVQAKAPDVPIANISLAFYTGFVLGELPRDQRPVALAEARRASQRALSLAPEFGDTYATWCLLHTETRMRECEDQLRAGNRVDPDAPYLNGFLADELRAVGRFDEAVEVTRLSYTHDPYNFFKIRAMLRMAEYDADSDGARDLYQRGIRWWPQMRDTFFRHRFFGLIDRGDLESIERLEEEVGPKALPSGYQKSGAIVAAVKSKSAAALRRTCANAQAWLFQLRCMLAFAKIGDEDSAYAIADELYPRRVGRTPEETERIWLDDPDGGGGTEFVASPAAAPMRRDPRFVALTQRTGLLAYWRSGRPPDFCRKQPEPICAQLLKR